MSSQPIDGGGGGGDPPTNDEITVQYEVVDATLRVTVDRDAPAGYYSGAVSATLPSTGEGAADDITVSTIPVTGGPDTGTIDLQEIGVEEGAETELFMTVAFDDGEQQQETIKVVWGDTDTQPQPGDVEVEIQGVQQSDNTLDVTVLVSTDTAKTIDYQLSISDSATGGTTSRSGTLSSSKTFPGDTSIETVSFGIGDNTTGTVTAELTAPAAVTGASDETDWGGTISVNSCRSQRTAGGGLSVSYTLAPSGAASGNATVSIDVNGKSVGSQTHFVPRRGGTFSQTISRSLLPVGERMPVEIEIRPL